jgi:hypothetical protein
VEFFEKELSLYLLLRVQQRRNCFLHALLGYKCKWGLLHEPVAVKSRPNCMDVHSVWVRRAPETVKAKLKSKSEFATVKGEELLVQMPVDVSKLSGLAKTLVEAGALTGEQLRVMVYGATQGEHKNLHSDINVNGDRFTAAVYLPFMQKDQTAEEYVEKLADQLCDSASRVQGTIQGLMVGLQQVPLKKPIKTF